MKTVIVSHEVKNYSEWRKLYDDDESNRSQAGFKVSGVYRSADNPNKISIIGEVPSEEAINKFMTNPDLKKTMEKAGVLGMPNVKILDKV